MIGLRPMAIKPFAEALMERGVDRTRNNDPARGWIKVAPMAARQENVTRSWPAIIDLTATE